VGLRNPTAGLPLAAACWFAKAIKPAHKGAASAGAPHFGPGSIVIDQGDLNVGHGGYVRNVAHGIGAAEGGHVDGLLIAGNRVVSADAATAVAPCGFRIPRPAGRGGGEGGSPNRSYVGIVGGRPDGP